jgi:hypothetical protein
MAPHRSPRRLVAVHFAALERFESEPITIEA